MSERPADTTSSVPAPVPQPPVVIRPPRDPAPRRVSIFHILERLETGAVAPDAGAEGMSELRRQQLAEVHRLAAELRAALAALDGPVSAGPAEGPQSSGPGRSSTSPAAPARYVVQPGDTLSSIARRLELPGGWRPLYERNVAVIGPDPDRLAVGIILEIPTQ